MLPSQAKHTQYPHLVKGISADSDIAQLVFPRVRCPWKEAREKGRKKEHLHMLLSAMWREHYSHGISTKRMVTGADTVTHNEEACRKVPNPSMLFSIAITFSLNAKSITVYKEGWFLLRWACWTTSRTRYHHIGSGTMRSEFTLPCTESHFVVLATSCLLWCLLFAAGW